MPEFADHYGEWGPCGNDSVHGQGGESVRKALPSRGLVSAAGQAGYTAPVVSASQVPCSSCANVSRYSITLQMRPSRRVKTMQ